jgi:hypothetical protein
MLPVQFGTRDRFMHKPKPDEWAEELSDDQVRVLLELCGLPTKDVTQAMEEGELNQMLRLGWSAHPSAQMHRGERLRRGCRRKNRFTVNAPVRTSARC